MIKISIILPIYNGEKYIKETIDSVLQQTLGDFELIIINDHSSDNSEKIILGYKDKRIVYLRNEKNLNIVGSRNKGLRAAKGDYICFLDQDDIFIRKDKLEIQSDFLDNDKEYGMIGSSSILIDEKGNRIGEITARTTDYDLKKHLIMSNQFTCGTVMFRRSLIEKIGYLDKTYNKSDDYQYRLKIGKITKIENIKEYLFAYRIHTNNTTSKGLNKYKMIWMGFVLGAKYGRYYPNYLKQILFRFFGDFIIPNWIVQKIIKSFKHNI